ncbi:M15 family metallopeptidase [Pseudokineococcus lusitanus]|uniref:D-alanyl-D-alanine carboxypeptidase-like protein n=1 Tax=Pseudokineococcus lusitanus TaxID=763993 RepID=A0A3N1GAM7_9ACTN|nr:M15 family metallopeptidase [Pseudokineococcus lusitanus]ROP27295.1 D-alanyl-D-alanine carboxypeptidase-like protein [Pseudokineococcus lusitanus]
MEALSSITARMSTLQAHLDALSTGRPAAATTAAPASADAFAQALAQQVGGGGTTTAQQMLPGLTSSTPAGGAAAEPALTTTTTTLSSQGLSQLLESLTAAGRSTGTAPGAGGTAAVGGVEAPGRAAAPAVATSGKVDGKGVPLELKAYGNGKVPEAQLVEIGGAGSGERMWAPAAEAFDRMSAAARADGVRFSVNDSYRSYGDQVDMAERKGLRSQGGLAAAPGTSSHGWGLAVDLQLDGKALGWMRDNAGRFGFAETVSGEPWHWGFSPARAA